MLRRPPRSTLVPYTTLVRSQRREKSRAAELEGLDHLPPERRIDRLEAIRAAEARGAAESLTHEELLYYVEQSYQVVLNGGTRGFLEYMQGRGVPVKDAKRVYALVQDRIIEESRYSDVMAEALSKQRLESIFQKSMETGKLNSALKALERLDEKNGIASGENPLDLSSITEAVRTASAEDAAEHDPYRVIE